MPKFLMEEKSISTPTAVPVANPDIVEPPPSPNKVVVDAAAATATGGGTTKHKSWRFWVAFAFLFLCAFISAIDATILGTALPQIAEEVNGTSILAFWCATSFFLAKTVVQPGNQIPFILNLYLILSVGEHL